MHNNHNGKNIHNIAVVGKDGSGKTLFVNTLLKMNNKNPVEVTIQPEEESRGFTIYNRFFHFDDGDVAINLIDTPGSTDFLASVKASLFPCTGAVYVASALEGTGGGMRVWERIVINNTPRSVFVNMMDMPEANFEKTIQSIEASFVLKSIPLSIPWFEDGKLVGVIDVINRKLLRGDSGKTKAEDLPVDAVDVTELHRSTTYERLAELDDELMEYYIEEKDAPYELLIKVLTAGVKSCEITPVFAGSAALNIGIGVLYDFIKINYPAHGQGKTFEARKGRAEDTEPVERKLDASEPFAGVVFRTTFDRYVGKLSYVYVISGVLKKGTKLLNSSNSAKLLTGRMSIVNGDDTEEVDEAYPGDIIVLEKEDELSTNQTICDVNNPIFFKPIRFLEPRCTSRLELTNSGKDSRIMDAVNKLIAADPSLKMHVNPDTKEVLFSGVGTTHLEVAREHLKNVYDVEINLVEYQIAYLETIVGKATVQGKYKKQSGGHGQFGDVHIILEPNPRGAGFEFVDKIVGGAIPRNYIPGVEKGVIEALSKGVLAGYPVVDVKVTLFDGSFHNVDSSDFAFQRAGSMALKKAMKEAKPVLLEAIMEMEIDVPESDVGKVTKDLSGRRGKVSSYSYKQLSTIVHAEAPMAELADYAQALRGMTGGLGLYDMKLKSHEILSSVFAEKVIAARKTEEEE